MGTMYVSGSAASSPTTSGGIFDDPTTRTIPSDTSVASMTMSNAAYIARIKSDPLTYSSPARSDIFEMNDSFHELNLRIVEQLLESQ